MFSSLTADYWISCCSLRDASLCFIIIVWYTKRETNIQVNTHKTYYGYVHMHTQTHRAVWKLFVMRRWLWSDCVLSGSGRTHTQCHTCTHTNTPLSVSATGQCNRWMTMTKVSVCPFICLSLLSFLLQHTWFSRNVAWPEVFGMCMWTVFMKRPMRVSRNIVNMHKNIIT